MSLVEHASGKRAVQAYIVVCLQIHCNPSSYFCICCRNKNFT